MEGVFADAEVICVVLLCGFLVYEFGLIFCFCLAVVYGSGLGLLCLALWLGFRLNCCIGWAYLLFGYGSVRLCIWGSQTVDLIAMDWMK